MTDGLQCPKDPTRVVRCGGHWQDRPPTGLLGSGPTIKVLVGALDGKGDAGSEREEGHACVCRSAHTLTFLAVFLSRTPAASIGAARITLRA